MPSEHDPAPDAPTDGTDASLNALLEAAQEQLRGVVEQATSSARKDVEAAAAALAERESEINGLEASLTSERLQLAADRENLERHVASVTERERAAAATSTETAELKERTTAALANALERSAQLVEEAEARVEESETRSRAEIEAELLSARAEATEIEAQAARRLEAVGNESEATLQRAVDRGLKIVSTAEVSAERSKAELRQLVSQIEEYLDREKMQIDLEAELQIDLRQEATEETIANLDWAKTLAPAEVTPVLVAAEASTDEAQAPRAADAVACDPAVEAYFEPDAPKAAIEDAADDRVADAVRRAVRNWSESRQQAE
jgi:hypothetical protein